MQKIKRISETAKGQKLLQAKTPEEYIDLSVKSKLSQSEKAELTRVWLSQNTKYDITHIQHARNRHPFWKAKKMAGSRERNQKRFAEYDYSGGKTKSWDEKTLSAFIEKTDEHTDRELAQQFERSIPAIQGIRRKINLARKILDAEGRKKVRKDMLLKKVMNDEKTLRKRLNELS